MYELYFIADEKRPIFDRVTLLVVESPTHQDLREVNFLHFMQFWGENLINSYPDAPTWRLGPLWEIPGSASDWVHGTFLTDWINEHRFTKISNDLAFWTRNAQHTQDVKDMK